MTLQSEDCLEIDISETDRFSDDNQDQSVVAEHHNQQQHIIEDVIRGGEIETTTTTESPSNPSPAIPKKKKKKKKKVKISKKIIRKVMEETYWKVSVFNLPEDWIQDRVKIFSSGIG